MSVKPNFISEQIKILHGSSLNIFCFSFLIVAGSLFLLKLWGNGDLSLNFHLDENFVIKNCSMWSAAYALIYLHAKAAKSRLLHTGILECDSALSCLVFQKMGCST